MSTILRKTAGRRKFLKTMVSNAMMLIEIACVVIKISNPQNQKRKHHLKNGMVMHGSSVKVTLKMNDPVDLFDSLNLVG